MDDLRNCQSALLSPVQTNPYLFVPRAELLEIMNGLLFLDLRYKLVA